MSRKSQISLKRLSLSAMLMAMSVVIGIFCKTVLNFDGGLFRVTFENLPIILAGIMFGPFYGGLVGCGADLVSYLLSFQAYPLNLIVTFGATMMGVISGAVAKFFIKKHGTLQIIIAGGLSHIVCSMIIKPIGLFTFYGWAVLFRIPLYLVIAPIEIAVICFLFKNSAFKKLIEKEDV